TNPKDASRAAASPKPNAVAKANHGRGRTASRTWISGSAGSPRYEGDMSLLDAPDA
ncbi:unnamed protein product, partial [Ascophyllum nodosum]